MVYNELRKVAPPPEVHSSDDWSLVDETWINERAKELIGPRPGNILWRLVAIYSPGAVGSVAGAIGEVSEAESMAGTIRGVNPTGSRVNCVNCAISADYTLAGNPTVAGPEGPYSYLQLANWMGSRFVAVTGEMQVADMLIGSGEGAQGIVYGESLVGANGHVWNAVNQGGTIRFLDSQVIRGGVNNAVTGVNNFKNYQNFRFMLTRPGTPP
jgi:hypothetical protein